MHSPTTGLRLNKPPFVSLVRCLVCLYILVSAGCQPLTATVLPTPEILQIEYTPTLSAWTTLLNRCAASLPEIGLTVSETPASRLDPTRVDIALRFGPAAPTAQNAPSPFYAAVLSQDEVVLAVNANNPVVSLTPQVISAIFSGQIKDWNNLDRPEATPQPTQNSLAIQAWSYPPEDDVRLVFDQAFMQGYTPTVQTYLAPNASAMLEALAQNPGAVGYVLKSQLNSSVRRVMVNGQPSFNLTQPILAFSMKEPQGYARQLLLCLQGK